MTNLFEKLRAEEEKFFANEFLAPVLRGRPVRIRISGVVMSLSVKPKKFQGWGVFRCLDSRRAQFVQEPTLKQKADYLELYPRFTFIVCAYGDRTYGIMASTDSRLKVVGRVPIALPVDVQMFDAVNVRWDGETFWYEGNSRRRSKAAVVLRERFAANVEPDKIELPGLTPGDLLAYRTAFELDVVKKRNTKEGRLKSAVERAGGVYRSHIERGNTYTVELLVDGQTYRPVVDSTTLQVSSAGICLSGTDRVFDLQSLVGVYLEGQQRHLINPPHNHDYEDDYDDYD